jgi:hypothetical protein
MFDFNLDKTTGSNLAAIAAIGAVACLIAAMLIGPAFLSPPEFNWVRHTTSQQAGQATPGAWLMRLGFTGFGAGILVASILQIAQRTAVHAALVIFGAGMIAAAIWSHACVIPGVASDLSEDKLHSVASAVVGAAFTAACAASLFAPGGSRGDLMAWAGLIIAVAIPLGMNAWGEWSGLMQRGMFLFSCLFVLREFAGR